MNKEADLVKGHIGANPFRDHQARTFSSARSLSEFYPTSIFWSLFNDQHEVLLGRRGSGKTILLRMMRYSLLKMIEHPTAKKLIENKQYFGITVSTHLEFIGNLIHQEIPERDRLLHFQFGFNCMLARSFLKELNSFVKEKDTFVERGKLSESLAKEIAQIWFPNKDFEDFHKLEDLDRYIAQFYESSSIENGTINAPTVFQNTICRPIQAVSSAVSGHLGCEEEPTWIVCIDEAEFLPDVFQRCINNLFRADSRKIVIKMATLPFSHRTTETLSPGIFAEANGNDFSYRSIDMRDDSADFLNVTNNLCKVRLKPIIGNSPLFTGTLEGFVGRVKDDDWVDYYRQELNNKNCRYEDIFFGIISQFSDQRRASVPKQKNKRKQTYDKYAPIYFFREMYKKSQVGNYTPGWYAGSQVIRKISDGNPRNFIKLMHELFRGATEGSLSTKKQHKIVYAFSDEEFKYLESMPSFGPYLYEILKFIATKMQQQTHGGDLLSKGYNFKISKTQFTGNKKLIDSIKFGVAHLALKVDDNSLYNDISYESELILSNYISALYWIPMRKGDPSTIKLPSFQHRLFEVNNR